MLGEAGVCPVCKISAHSDFSLLRTGHRSAAEKSQDPIGNPMGGWDAPINNILDYWHSLSSYISLNVEPFKQENYHQYPCLE